MAAVPKFAEATLEALCNVLADTATGLTGSEIGSLLQRCGISDPDPTITKRRRLLEALRKKQDADGVGNHVAAFIQTAMAPVRYVDNRTVFDERRSEVNRVLAFQGLSLGDDGQLRTVTQARTISEADERAGRLRSELGRRRVHPDVLQACRAELLQDNYFHAVLEATKSVAEKIRARTGLVCEGAALVDGAFGRSNGLPLLAFNSLQTDSECSEHVGMMNIIKGMFSAFRNPTAHEPKGSWVVTEEALDLLSLVSLLHRRLDQAVRTDTGSVRTT